MSDGLHVHAYGSADSPPLVILHGVCGHGARFRRLAETHLRDHHVIAPDLRGHGLSDWLPPWTLEQHAADLLRVLDSRGIDKAPVVGHSYGGLVALHLARLAPQRVTGLVLLDPAVNVKPAQALEYAQTSDVVRADRAEALATQRHDWPGEPEEHIEEEVSANWVEVDGTWRPRYCPAAVITAWSEMCRAPVLPPPGLPTLLVEATREEFVGPDFVKACRFTMGAEFTHVGVDLGHMVYLENPAGTAKLIKEFVS
ncbi:alpha/beta fold hydrolase [Actinokineospora sp. HUAS TT18]|uniref:alpha/beta fold hydrolase n=1 Tax=Actinokineospora sp. HUAS TT18 TaxID=3447451 RepID=UPI003F52794F